MNTPRRTPKKSEKIEVRVSHEEKQDLQMLARRRGQTVSTIVRGLVADHLRAARRAELQSVFRNRADMILRPLTMHPRKLAAALAASLGLGAMLLPAAMADPLKVELHGQIETTAENAISRHGFASVLRLEPGAPGTFRVETPRAGVDGYRIELTVSPDSGDRVVIDMNIYRGLEGGELIAHPRLIAETGEEARVVIGGPAESYEFSAVVSDS